MAKRWIVVIVVACAGVGAFAIMHRLRAPKRVAQVEEPKTPALTADAERFVPPVAQASPQPAAEMPAPTPAQPTAELPKAPPLVGPPKPAVVTGNPSKPAMTPKVKIDIPPHPAVPVGRFALGFVGMDETSENVWAAVINDPTVPAESRKDLIEDLNEDGFPDPKHVGPEDLPLIASRLDLIEQLAPESMDDTNLAAFLEAYKDLSNMMARAMQ